ncbi:MAG: YigZ family protein [Clostridia bacterium]|nr:YigZ family protein [Clostridia bacterium]
MKYYSLINKTDLKGNYGQIAEGLIVEKQSKFISYLFKIENESQAQEYIEKIKKDNLSARHVVYIYSYFKDNIVNIRFSDDGEPKGTGTKAIYELLEKECITNICIVIVRYFGGILLGAGPLSRTYLNSARECIDACSKKEMYNYLDYSFDCTYNAYNILKNRLEKYIEQEYVIIENSEFKENVTMKLKIVDFEYESVKKIVEEVNYGS